MLKNLRPSDWILIAYLVTMTAAIVVFVVPPSFILIEPIKLFGERSLAELLGGAAGLGVALWGIYLLNRRTKANEDQVKIAAKTELATRFQKGVELIASANRTARIGGIYIIRDVANENPKTYGRSAIDLLTALIEDQSASDRSFVEERAKEIASGSEKLPIGKSDVSEALEAIGQILRQPHEYFNTRNTKIIIKKGYFVDGFISGGEYPTVYFDDCYFDSFHLFRMRFADTIFGGCSVGSLYFHGVDCEELKFNDLKKLRNLSYVRFNGGQMKRSVFVSPKGGSGPHFDAKHTRLEGTTIDAQVDEIENCYFVVTPPTLVAQRWRDQSSVEIYRWNEDCDFANNENNLEFVRAEGQVPEITSEHAFEGQ